MAEHLAILDPAVYPLLVQKEAIPISQLTAAFKNKDDLER